MFHFNMRELWSVEVIFPRSYRCRKREREGGREREREGEREGWRERGEGGREK